MSTQSRPSVTTHDEEQSPLRALLEVDPPEGGSCPLVTEAPNATHVTQTTTHRGTCRSCQTEVTVVEDDDAETKYVASTITDGCVCLSINKFECVFDVEGVRDGSLVISIVVRERDVLGEIVEAIRETGATVQLKRIQRHGEIDPGRVELDASAITSKQREAVELAVELGYYDKPRQVGLDELADRLDISKSAVSQRLNAVELTLVRSLVSE